MSTNQTERELPDEIEEAITEVCWSSIQLERSDNPIPFESESWNLEALTNLRQVILAALEPERELRERCERLRVKVIDTYADIYASVEFEEAEGLHPGDLDDDLTT
jgi:hypothetical protein